MTALLFLARAFLAATVVALLFANRGAAEQARPPAADLVLKNGKIVTVDEARPEAEAMAIAGNRILAVGSDAEIERYVGAGTEVIDLGGRLATPGFIEAHAHFLGVGQAQLQLDLMKATSWEEIVTLVAAAVKEAQPGELIRGRGWHQEKWTETPTPNVDGVPLHHSLSAISPENPVLLVHASGHATFANGKAMELCGISAATPDPDGGQVVKDGAGEPIGLFLETAAGLLGEAAAGARQVSTRRRAELAIEELLAKGITSFYDAGASFAEVDTFREMADDGSLRVRLWVMLGASNEELAEKLDDYRLIGYGDERLTVRAIKRYMDGALGSHGAWLLEPYFDLPESSGLNVMPIAEQEETAGLALAHGFQLCTHAIGDRANRETLDLYERAFEGHEGTTDLRWRIEHAQHLHPDDVPRFASLGVIAAMQGVHCTSDGPWVAERLGEERAKSDAYVWQDLLKSGAVICNGTDAPVEDVDPMACFHSTVSRRLPDGSVFFGEQRMSRMEALRSYTLDAAYSGFEELQKGSLEPGKLADVTVLSRDILTIPEEEIPGTAVVYTIVGGKVEYRAR